MKIDAKLLKYAYLTPYVHIQRSEYKLGLS